MYSIDSKVSFQSLETFYLKISTVCHSTSFIGVVVGTKKDCEKKREVSTKEAEQWASNKGFLFTECSALTGENIEKPFQLIVHKLRNKLTVNFSLKKKTNEKYFLIFFYFSQL